MKGRKNKSALISSSSRSVWPMHIQEARMALSFPRFSALSLAIPRSPSLSPRQRKLYEASPGSRGWCHRLVRTTADSILTNVRHPLISRLPSLIAPPR